MEQLINDRLQENLGRLKLIRAAEILDTLIMKAEEEKISYPAFLDHLLEEEVAAKDKRRIQTAMKTAGLPVAKTIEEYDFSFHPKLNKKEVMSLFDLDFIRQYENVIFLGPPGVGKTHLAISLAIKACYHGFKVYFTTMDTLMKKLKDKKQHVKGRCSRCQWLDVCGGNFRVRAEAVTGDVWAPDPACYLTHKEIGIERSEG